MKHFINNEDYSLADDEVLEVGYTTSNNPMRSPPIVDANDDTCYAKIVSTQSNNHLSIQRYVKATSSRAIIDPWNDTEISRAKRLSMNNDPYVFKKINKKGFDLFMNYLKTRNGVYLRDAEKELMNG
jgi:hypothetical protein